MYDSRGADNHVFWFVSDLLDIEGMQVYMVVPVCLCPWKYLRLWDISMPIQLKSQLDHRESCLQRGRVTCIGEHEFGIKEDTIGINVSFNTWYHQIGFKITSAYQRVDDTVWAIGKLYSLTHVPSIGFRFVYATGIQFVYMFGYWATGVGWCLRPPSQVLQIESMQSMMIKGGEASSREKGGEKNMSVNHRDKEERNLVGALCHYFQRGRKNL